MIGIINYGAGNLHSVNKAFTFLNADAKILSWPEEINGITKLALPGVGAFGNTIKMLRKSGFFPIVKDWLQENRPFLGICLGMQVLLESSDESGIESGFGFFKGKNKKFTQGKVPQIGWNRVEAAAGSKLFSGIKNGSAFYFVHSYYAAPEDSVNICGKTTYNIEYPSAMESGNIYAVQFHPEKSGRTGLRLLNNWVKI